MQATQAPAVIPFQLVVGGRGPGGSYLLRATAAGRIAEAALELPALPAEGAALGATLGAALFPPPLRRLLLDVARGADEAGARVQIQLQVAPPELAALPWEWLSLGKTEPWRPAIRDDYALVRVGRPGPRRPTLTVSGPLRLLIVCAPGCEPAAAHLGHALAEPVRAGLITADLLSDATPEELTRALDEEPCHLLHIVAPADLVRGEPRLRLGRSMDAPGLIGLLGDHPGLRLVTFAAAGPAQPATALAAALHDGTGLACLALGGLDKAQAANFCAACYAGIAAGDPADLAATDGRLALANADGPWGLPQIYLGSGCEQLFRLRPLEQAARVAIAPADIPSERAQPAPARSTRSQRRTRSRRGEQENPLWRMPLTGIPWPRLTLPALPAAMGRPLSLFAVQSTAVGAPARRAPAEERRGPALNPRLAVLALALVVLVLMVVPVLRLPGDEAAPEPAREPLSLPLPALVPTLQAQVDAELAAIGRGGPLSAPEPLSYATYVVAEGDTIESIARRAGSQPMALVAFNYLNPSEPLRPGRPLVLPIYAEGEALPPAPIMHRGNPNRPQVALTFDVEIDDMSLYAILEILREHGLKATFFVTGGWVEAFPEAAKAIVSAGHELANHSLTHPSFVAIGADGALNELEATERIVREVTGATSRPYFRFPYGDATPAMVELVGRQGYVAYHWSADDYAIPSWIAQASASPQAAYGGILLMHGRSSTVEALPDWLDQLAAIGLQPTTLGEVMR